jgi:hypothetical protein
MPNLTPIVAFDAEVLAEEVLTALFGSDQQGSFRRLLSATGELPATHMGAYAANLTSEEASALLGQETIDARPLTWEDALTAAGLRTIDED